MRVALRLVALSAIALSSLLLPGAAGGAFPGTNGRIAFVSDRDGNQEIYISNPDGSDPLRLTDTRPNDTDPAYSPDGSKIAFARSSDVWVMNANGTGQVAITGIEGVDSQPAWSPDGTQIVYVSNHSTPTGGTTGPELFIKNADGSGTERQVTNTPSNAASQAPAWSPAGDQIAYESNATTGFDIYTIAPSVTAGFGTLRSANELNQNYQHPSWSPDGARIAFERGVGTAPSDTTKEIWTMRADGSDPVQLTSNSFNDVDPAYSPDCTAITYESNADGDRDIYTRAATQGGTSTNLTDLVAGTDVQPDWGAGGPASGVCAASPGGGGGGPGPGGGGPVTLADLDDPTLGVDVNVAPVSGRVLVGIPAAAARASGSGRASQKGITFVPLSEARQIPVGSFLNTRRGRVRMQSAVNRAGTRQTGDFFSGLFQVRQSRKRSARGLTDLVMKGSSFRRCRAASGRRASASGLSRRAIRRLRANARGRFRTSGRNSSATVRGTKWEVIDRCDGTLTKVSRGRVVVRDFRRKRNVLVRAGKSYLAKARR